MTLPSVSMETKQLLDVTPTCPLSQQVPGGGRDPADAEPPVVSEQEVPRWAGLPQRRQASLQEPVGEAAWKHLLLRRCLLLRQDGPAAQSLGEPQLVRHKSAVAQT